MVTPKPHSREQVRRALSRTIRTLRQRANEISQEDLALTSGVDRSYMSQIERSLRSASVEIVERLLPVLGVNWAQFGAEFDKHLRGNNRKS